MQWYWWWSKACAIGDLKLTPLLIGARGCITGGVRDASIKPLPRLLQWRFMDEPSQVILVGEPMVDPTVGSSITIDTRNSLPLSMRYLEPLG